MRVISSLPFCHSPVARLFKSLGSLAGGADCGIIELFHQTVLVFQGREAPLAFLLWTLLLAFTLLLPRPPAVSPSPCALFYHVAFNLFFTHRVAFATWWPTICDVNLVLLWEILCEQSLFREGVHCREVGCKSPSTVSADFCSQLPSWHLPLAHLLPLPLISPSVTLLLMLLQKTLNLCRVASLF